MGKFEIKRPERDVSLCLDASLSVEWENAERALSESRSAPAPTMLGEVSPQVAAAEVVREIESRMAADVLVFRLRALPRDQWSKINAKHPAREGDVSDKAFGANRDAFFAEVIPLSIVGVTRQGKPTTFEVSEDWEDLADGMTDRQYSDFADAALMLNRGEVSVPTSRAASRVLRSLSES